jgi:hypothetical protein
MFYVGLAIHTKDISTCTLSETGQVAHRSRVRRLEALMITLDCPIASRFGTRPVAAMATFRTCCGRWPSRS